MRANVFVSNSAGDVTLGDVNVNLTDNEIVASDSEGVVVRSLQNAKIISMNETLVFEGTRLGESGTLNRVQEEYWLVRLEV
jgi:hypothetical protein